MKATSITAVKVGDRVSGGAGEDYDTGRVDEINGDMATVAWDSGVVTPAPLSLLTKGITMETNPIGYVADRQIQHDASGVGHCWRNIDRDDIPEDIVTEIEGEIIDGVDETDDFVASNGQHYRW